MNPLKRERHDWSFVPDTLRASPLYSAWWQGLKEDAEMQILLHLVKADQPMPVTLFTTINYLVLTHPSEPLACYYPALMPEAAPDFTQAYPQLRAFMLAHWEELCMLLPTARLQTNEVTRCANLLPAFVLASECGGSQPLHLIEVGSSAGLNLLWPSYRYQYQQQGSGRLLLCGMPHALVHIRCELLGHRLPPLPRVLPRVTCCEGIELLPRRISDALDRRWLRAAIWPEEVERYRLLEEAIGYARQMPLRLHEGEASTLLPTLLSAIPPVQTVIVWHSFALNQGPPATKALIEAHLAEASRSRTIYRVSLEVEDARGAQLELWTYAHGEVRAREHLATCALHGERMTWLHEGA